MPAIGRTDEAHRHLEVEGSEIAGRGPVEAVGLVVQEIRPVLAGGETRGGEVTELDAQHENLLIETKVPDDLGPRDWASQNESRDQDNE